jgi:hypothetical protein
MAKNRRLGSFRIFPLGLPAIPPTPRSSGSFVAFRRRRGVRIDRHSGSWVRFAHFHATLVLAVGFVLRVCSWPPFWQLGSFCAFFTAASSPNRGDQPGMARACRNASIHDQSAPASSCMQGPWHIGCMVPRVLSSLGAWTTHLPSHAIPGTIASIKICRPYCQRRRFLN